MQKKKEEKINLLEGPGWWRFTFQMHCERNLRFTKWVKRPADINHLASTGNFALNHSFQPPFKA
jgi:hypothetical protein